MALGGILRPGLGNEADPITVAAVSWPDAVLPHAPQWWTRDCLLARM